MEQVDDLHSVRRITKNGTSVVMVGRKTGEIIMKIGDTEHVVFNSKNGQTNEDFLQTLTGEESSMLLTFTKELVMIETERLMDKFINDIDQLKD